MVQYVHANAEMHINACLCDWVYELFRRNIS